MRDTDRLIGHRMCCNLHDNNIHQKCQLFFEMGMLGRRLSHKQNDLLHTRCNQLKHRSIQHKLSYSFYKSFLHQHICHPDKLKHIFLCQDLLKGSSKFQKDLCIMCIQMMLVRDLQLYSQQILTYKISKITYYIHNWRNLNGKQDPRTRCFDFASQQDKDLYIFQNVKLLGVSMNYTNHSVVQSKFHILGGSKPKGRLEQLMDKKSRRRYLKDKCWGCIESRLCLKYSLSSLNCSWRKPLRLRRYHLGNSTDTDSHVNMFLMGRMCTSYQKGLSMQSNCHRKWLCLHNLFRSILSEKYSSSNFLGLQHNNQHMKGCIVGRWSRLRISQLGK